MPMLQLTLENLAELKGGLIERMLSSALNRVAQDLRTAPEIADWRKVVLEIRARPTIEDGELGDVIVEFAVSPKVPARVTSSRMQVKSATNGAKQLFFSVDAPDNPAQKTITDIEGVE